MQYRTLLNVQTVLELSELSGKMFQHNGDEDVGSEAGQLKGSIMLEPRFKL